MNIQRWRKTSHITRQSGQAMLFIILALGLALLRMIAFAVDMGNLWFHRQNAQTTTDAACTAAAMDMLFTATGGGAKGGFTFAPCVYASKNMGFDASTLTAATPGYDVSFTFPASVTGLPNCTTGTGAPAICNDPDAISNNFVQVNVQDRVRLSFAALLSG